MKTPLKLSLLISVFLFSACSTAPKTPPAPPIEELSAHREALFVEVENTVEMRQKNGDAPVPAEAGKILYPGGSAQSGADGRARIDLFPEGTIIRLAPNSQFILEEFSTDIHTPQTKLRLLAGEIWIILSGGELETATSYGTASVRGSMMSVRFSPTEDGMLVTCLEGHCALENEAGKTELSEGFSSRIAAMGEAPTKAEPIPQTTLEEWKTNNPEASAWMHGTPLPAPVQDGNGVPNGTQPVKYNLLNNCVKGSWHWEFVGNETYTFTLSPGESASGQLPPDNYMVTDTLDGAGTHGPDFVQGGGFIDVRACPEQ
jgi:hypothetical protein